MKTNQSTTVRNALVIGVIVLVLAAAIYMAAPSGKVQAQHDEHAEAEHAPQEHAHSAEGGEAHEDKVTLTAEAIQQNGIRVEPARKQSLDEALTVPGRISYNMEQMAHVGTPIQGRVAEIKVKLGDHVEKGDALLIIDSPALGEAESDFLQKKTQVEVATSAIEVAKTAADRAKRLLEGKGIALGEYQRREGEYKSASGAQKSAKSALTAAENKLHLYGVDQQEIARLVSTGEVNPRFSVRAPIGGQVIHRESTLGEVVGPEREALVTLADMKTLWVLAEVPENRIQRVALNSPASVALEALGDKGFKGKVSYIAPELSKETRTVQVRVEITDASAPISPGMFAQVHLALERTADAAAAGETVAVPEAAIQTFENSPTVFIQAPAPPGTFAARPVKVGPSNGTSVPILSGLDEGTPIVVEGAFIVKAELAKGEMEGKTCSGH